MVRQGYIDFGGNKIKVLSYSFFATNLLDYEQRHIYTYGYRRFRPNGKS